MTGTHIQTKISVPGYEKDVEFGVMYDFAYQLSDGSGIRIYWIYCINVGKQHDRSHIGN